jgi:hypothetical protein
LVVAALSTAWDGKDSSQQIPSLKAKNRLNLRIGKAADRGQIRGRIDTAPALITAKLRQKWMQKYITSPSLAGCVVKLKQLKGRHARHPDFRPDR